MLAKLIALLVLSSALAVLGQDETTHTTYPRNLDQEPVRGRIIGAIDGDTIKALTASRQAAKEYGMSKTAYTELALKDRFKKDGIK